MGTAILIIAICEIIRTVQITIDIAAGIRSRRKLNNEFIESLKKDNRDWAEDLLEEFLEYEKEHSDDRK